MSGHVLFNATAAFITGLSPITVNYTIPASALVEEEMEIETVQQFIDIFCSEKKIEFDEEKQEEKEVLYLIEEINEDNYWIILEGYALYSTFDEDFQKGINEWYENPDLEFEDEKEVTYESLCADALSFQEELEKEEAEKEKEDNKKEDADKSDSDKEESKKEDTDKVDSDKEESKKEDSDKVDSDKEESKKEDSDKVDSDKEESKKEDSDKVVADKSETLKPEVVKPEADKKEMVAVPQVLKVEKEEALKQPAPVQVQPKLADPVAKPAPVVVEKEANQATKSFVASYVSNANGVVYGSATSFNYKQIISGLPSWNRMNISQKKEINTFLREKVGKSYQVLLKEAQSVQFSIVNPTVDTATPLYHGFYGTLCALSISLLGYLVSKYKQL